MQKRNLKIDTELFKVMYDLAYRIVTDDPEWPLNSLSTEKRSSVSVETYSNMCNTRTILMTTMEKVMPVEGLFKVMCSHVDS